MVYCKVKAKIFLSHNESVRKNRVNLSGTYFSYTCVINVHPNFFITFAHCFVSSNSFHGQITQKAVHQITDSENKKCSHWSFFGTNHPPTHGFWAGEALEAWNWDYLYITLAQKWHSFIFQISAEKSFPACQKGSSTFSSNFGGCNLQKSCGKTSTFIQ